MGETLGAAAGDGGGGDNTHPRVGAGNVPPGRWGGGMIYGLVPPTVPSSPAQPRHKLWHPLPVPSHGPPQPPSAGWWLCREGRGSVHAAVGQPPTLCDRQQQREGGGVRRARGGDGGRGDTGASSRRGHGGEQRGTTVYWSENSLHSAVGVGGGGGRRGAAPSREPQGGTGAGKWLAGPASGPEVRGGGCGGGMRGKRRSPAPLCPQQHPGTPQHPGLDPSQQAGPCSGQPGQPSHPRPPPQSPACSSPPGAGRGRGFPPTGTRSSSPARCQQRGGKGCAVTEELCRRQRGGSRRQRRSRRQGPLWQRHGPAADVPPLWGRMSPLPGDMRPGQTHLSPCSCPGEQRQPPAPKPLQPPAGGQPPLAARGQPSREGTRRSRWVPRHGRCRGGQGASAASRRAQAGLRQPLSGPLRLVLEVGVEAVLCIVLEGERGVRGCLCPPPDTPSPPTPHGRGVTRKGSPGKP